MRGKGRWSVAEVGREVDRRTGGGGRRLSRCMYSGMQGEARGLGRGGRMGWVITGARRGEACNQLALRKECSSSSHVITAI